MESVGHVQSVRARVSQRRTVRARVGVLEDLRRVAGGRRASAHGYERA